MVCALWSWHVGAIAGCRIFLRSSRRRSVARGEWLQRKDFSHKTQVLILQMYQGSELGSLRYDSGMIRGMVRKPIFFEFRKLCCLSLFFPPSTYHDCYLMAAMARPARRPWTGPEHEEYEDLNAHLWFIPAALPASLLDVLAFSSATLRLMFLFDGILVWLPASHSRSHPPHQPHQITQQVASHAASQPPLASRIASHPTSSSNCHSHLASHTASRH